MSGVLQQLPEGAAVAIIRLRSLGDCVLTTPAVALLKQHRPDLRIGIVVEDRFADLFRPHADIADVLPPSASRIRRFHPDLTLNFHGGTRSMILTAASGARFRAGFAHHSASALYNVRIPRAQEILNAERKVHTAEHLASAMFHLGVPPAPIPRASLLSDPTPPREPYAILHPFAATPEKTWPAERFLSVARHLKEEDDTEPVFIAGPDDDASPFTEFETVAGASLGTLKSLISGAKVFIGNDSGPAHIAAAFGVPTVVLFGPSDEVVWAPWCVESCALKSRTITDIPARDVLSALESFRVAS